MTTLMIKTHNTTGIKYFCKTTKTGEAFLKYNGSGLHWLRHIKKHGKDISTEIYAEFEDDDLMLVETALKFSKENNIIKSKEWANIVFENGLDGTIPGTKFSDETKKKMSISRAKVKFVPHTEETKEKIKLKRKLQIITKKSNEKRSNTLTGIKRSAETKSKMGKVQTDKPRVTCPHCSKVGAQNLMIRYHFENCKKKPQILSPF